MRVAEVELSCRVNGHVFLDQLVLGNYGTWTVRNEVTGEARVVDMFAAPVAVRIGELAEPLLPPVRDHEAGALQQEVIAQLADPDPDGNRFSTQARARCPLCGSTAGDDWRATGTYLEAAVEPATFVAAEAMTPDQLEAAVAEVLGRIA